MTSTATKPKKCFEDFEEGFTLNFVVPGLSVNDITEFATLYDPQRFHMDEQEASKTHFGGLVASGFQTQVLCFRPFCDAVLLDSFCVGSPGIDNLKWLRPWYANEDIHVETTLVAKKSSSSRRDRGYLNFEMKADVNGEPLLIMEWMVIILTREGLAS